MHSEMKFSVLILQNLWLCRRSFEPLVIPFKEQYKWWSSVELGRRVILVLFIVSFPQNEVAKNLTTIVCQINTNHCIRISLPASLTSIQPFLC